MNLKNFNKYFTLLLNVEYPKHHKDFAREFQVIDQRVQIKLISHVPLGYRPVMTVITSIKSHQISHATLLARPRGHVSQSHMFVLRLTFLVVRKESSFGTY